VPLTGAGPWPEKHDTVGDDDKGLPLEELLTRGVLWAINEELFWPHSAALALHLDSEGKVCGWSLQPSPDGQRVDIPKETKDKRWKAYRETVRELLGWGPGW
jgi:hypothetical protein